MKHLLFILVLILPLTANSQQNKSPEINYYLQKSLTKKKTANVLLLTGSALILTGAVVAGTAEDNTGWFFSETQMTGITISTLGVFSALTSVPFYISAHHNKKKSLKISPTTGIIQTYSVTEQNHYASAGLTIIF